MAGKPNEMSTARKPTIAIVGAGSLATFLAVALDDAGFTITEIVARDSPHSRRKASKLAAKVGAHSVTAHSAALDADLLWFCVPDREIRTAASALAAHLAVRTSRVETGLAPSPAAASRVSTHKPARPQGKPYYQVRFAFHSSGALVSRELDSLCPAGTALASVHPLMTFVAGAHPSLQGVPFAIEGDRKATRVAERIVHRLGGESFSLPAARKAAYHAWATMTSPLLLAYLVTLEEAARGAGLSRHDARRASLPIIRQTLANYSRLGPARSFSGPMVRGDAETVAKHLAALKKHPRPREVYVALARAALRDLPVKNQNELKRMLQK
ncbi:MAG: DUF2520 domain-containing protein [Acidobacteriia bacterium]|nr:DUF2520 domain-containing protein [Terriglobia bacterium]